MWDSLQTCSGADSPAESLTEERLQAAMGLVFEQLPRSAQNILLDAVTALYGQRAMQARAVWDVLWPGEARKAFADLQQGSLLTVDNGVIQVTDAIRSCAQQFISTAGGEFHGSRLWVQGGKIRGMGAVSNKSVLYALLVCIRVLVEQPLGVQR